MAASPILRAMFNFRPSLAHRVRCISVALTSAFWVAGAIAAPDLSSQASAVTPVVDPVSRFLADQGLIAAPGASKAEPAPSDSAFVEKIRDQASEMVLTAMNFLGVPYRRGGSNVDRGFDCSGFTRRVFEMSLGLVLPRRASEQAVSAGLLNIKRDELKPGDLVFFNTMRRTFSHVGIYVGDGKFIHAPKPGGEVRVEDMRAAYWDARFTGARRASPRAVGAPVSIEPVAVGPVSAGPVVQSTRTLY